MRPAALICREEPRDATSWRRFSAARSSRPACAMPKRRATSSPTSIAARADARADSADISTACGAEFGSHAAERLFTATPSAVPRQPACTAATAWWCKSASRIGKQSAVRIETVTPGCSCQQSVTFPDTPFAVDPPRATAENEFALSSPSPSCERGAWRVPKPCSIQGSAFEQRRGKDVHSLLLSRERNAPHRLIRYCSTRSPARLCGSGSACAARPISFKFALWLETGARRFIQSQPR